MPLTPPLAKHDVWVRQGRTRMMSMTETRRNLGWLRYVGWGGAVALVLAPLVAMQLQAPGVHWTGSDFVFAIVLIGGTGLALELAVRSTRNWAYRFGAGLGLLTGFLLIWSNLAVGYIGDGDSTINRVFLAIPFVALAGSALSRFRAAGMAWSMLAAGLLHAVAGAVGYPIDPVTGPISAVFMLLWLASAWLFRTASRSRA
jgi:hypothetical protein